MSGSHSVMVTGGSGFLGGFVLPLLIERGHRVAALARSEASAEVVRQRGATPVIGDLDVPGDLDASLRAVSPSALVNLASLGFGHAPAIVQAAEAGGVRRAVFVSTTGIFTKLNPQSKSVRLAAEETIRQSSLDWTIIRPTMIYGTPDDRNMWRLLRYLRRIPVMPMPGGGVNLQQPVHVADLATAIVGALERETAVGRAYDVAGPEALSFRQIVTSAGGAVGRSPRGLSIPALPVIRALRRLERTGRSGPIRAEQIERLIEDKAFDISDAARDLGHSPRPFDEGIRAEAGMNPT